MHSLINKKEMKYIKKKLQQEALPVWSNDYGSKPKWSDSRSPEPVYINTPLIVDRNHPELKQMEEAASEPRLILVFSGKRKSGKDYVTDWIQER